MENPPLTQDIANTGLVTESTTIIPSSLITLEPNYEFLLMIEPIMGSGGSINIRAADTWDSIGGYGYALDPLSSPYRAARFDMVGTPIPEPSLYASLAGIVALTCAFTRRQRFQKA